MRTTQQTYWPGVDGLRSLAFLMVFVHHCGNHPGLNRIINWGWLGVELFFVISGFLITSLLLKEIHNFGNIRLDFFYIRRILRIVPPFYTVLIASLSFPLAPIFLLQNTVFIGNFFAAKQLFNPFLAPLWSLCIEEQFYIFLPLSLLFIKSNSQRIILFLLIIAASFSYRLYLNQHDLSHVAWYQNTLSHLDPLMIGSLTAVLNCSTPLLNYCKRGVFVLSLAILLATVAVVPIISANDISIVPTITWCSVAFAGLLTCTCSWDPCKTLFSNKLLAAFGRKTYAMYLWHMAVLTALEPIADNWFLKASLGLILTYVIAEISWRFLEAPLSKLKGRFERHKRIELSEDTLDSHLQRTPELVMSQQS